MKREAVAFYALPPVIFQHSRDEVPLDIGRRCIVHHFPETPSLGVGRGHDAGALTAVFDDGLHHPHTAFQAGADKVGIVRFPARYVVGVILQVRTDSGHIGQHIDPVFLEMRRRADA